MKATIQYSAGFLVGGKIQRELQRAASDAGVNVEIEKSGGWLSRDYYVTVTGGENRVHAYRAAVSNWMKGIANS